MRILMVYAGPYPHLGGLSSHMELMGKGLRKLGHEIDYLSHASFPRTVRVLLLSGPQRVLDRVRRGLGVLFWLHASRLVFSVAISLMNHARRYDAVDAHHVSSARAGYMALRSFGTPIIQTVHTYYTYEMNSEGILEKGSRLSEAAMRFERRAYGQSTRLVAVDTRLRDYLISMSVPESKVEVIFNPVDTEVFAPGGDRKQAREELGLPHDKKIILCPRRLVKKNGVIYAAMAASHLKNETANFLLVYAGEGDEEASIRSLVAAKGIDKSVLFLGAVPHSRMGKLYQAADVVVIPSIHVEGMEEATSISALEAMASGVPVIASDIGGLKDIIKNGVTGILVPEKNEAQLADAIERLLSDSALNTRLSRNGSGFVLSNFSHMSRAKLLEEVVSKARRP